jgi:hypothetical protein
VNLLRSCARESIKQFGVICKVTSTIMDKPLDIIQFVSIENEQLLTTLIRSKEEIFFVNHLQGLFSAAMSREAIADNEVVIFQLLALTHYQFLAANANYMRCHLAEAFSAARVAIDAALIAAQIIADRSSQVAYVKREKPFDKLMRHYKNLIRDRKPLPHKLIPQLISHHDLFSSFASHADIQAFVHRVKTVRTGEKLMLAVQYFQFSTNATLHRIHWLNLLHTFVMTLDIFADFLVSEQKQVPAQWIAELHGLGAKIEQLVTSLKQSLPPDVELGFS